MLTRSTWLPKSTFASNLHNLKINICDLALDAYPVPTMLLVKFLLNYNASDEAFSWHEFGASDKISHTPLFLRCAFSSLNAGSSKKMTNHFVFFIFSYSKNESFNYADFDDEISTRIPYYFLLSEAPCLPDKLLQVLDVVNGFTRIGFSKNYPFVSVVIEPKICIMAKKMQSKSKFS